MQGKKKVFIRGWEAALGQLMRRGQSALIFGPRQTGKTTLIKKLLAGKNNTVEYLLQDPETRMELERNPSIIVRQIEAVRGKPIVFIDEAQKVPDLFDAVQILIDEQKASFLITGSSARKLRRRGTNLLPGRVKSLRLDPLTWGELGWIKQNNLSSLKSENINRAVEYSLEKSLVFGSLPGIVALGNDEERKDFLNAYAHIYLEEEIRAESLSRKIGAFSRFLELAANESGTSPNLSKLSMESGVSAPAIKEFFRLLEDTLVVERVDPYLKNARKRILSSSRYYFFDLGVRNSLAKMPLSKELINTQKGDLFEHAVVLEIIRRIRALNKNYKVCYWRTSGGAEVDCVIDLGQKVIPIEIKAGKRTSPSELRGLSSFLDEYKSVADEGLVVTMGERPEKLSKNITALPWNYL
jgi:predicted AAA+ superfamily ATPase